jgi:hypothetical protein
VESTFYSTAAQVTFALLGLWWVVVAERRVQWLKVAARRRQAYTVSMYFMLTGLMSLASLVSAGNTTIWRLAFGIAGGLGLLETVVVLWQARNEPESGAWMRALLAVTVPFYAAVVAVALHTGLAKDLGLNLKPLETEAIVVTGLIFLGVNVAWLLFFEPERDGQP